jgi:hypothetical protein
MFKHPSKYKMLGGGGGGGAFNGLASAATLGLSDVVQGKAPLSGLTDSAANLDPTNVQQADQARLNQAIADIQKQREVSQGILNNQISNTNQSLGTVQNSLDILQGAANGTAPSVAQGILQQGLDQGIAAQAALANSGSMANQLVRQKQAADTGAQLTQQTANQAGMLRAQEMAANRAAFNQGAQNLYGTNVGAQQSTQGILGNLATGESNAAQGGINAQQSAYNQSAQARTNLIGGILNGAGAAAGGLYTGGKVEGEEVVEGDSPANDVVPKMLSAGEIVIPKSATKSMEHAIEFLEKYLEKGEGK